MEPVKVRDEDTGWLVIVQTAYDAAIGSTLEDLTAGLIRYGLIALVLIALVMAGPLGLGQQHEQKKRIVDSSDGQVGGRWQGIEVRG